MSASPSLPLIPFRSSEHEPFDWDGSEHAPSALLLHGFMGTPAEMRGIGQHLHAAKWAVRGGLLPGFGRNLAHLPKTTKQDLITAAINEWNTIHNKPKPHVLIGFSMGGAIAVQIATLVKPDYLVLISPFTRFTMPAANFARLIKYVKSEIAIFEHADFSDSAIQKQLHEIDPHLNLDDPDVQAFLREKITIPTSAIHFLNQLRVDALRLAKKVACPVLVIQGSADTTVLPTHTRQFISRFNAPLTYYEVRGGHDMVKPFAIDSDPFEQKIVDFVQPTKKII